MSDETAPERRSSPVWAVAKGMGTVFKQTFRRDNTERYPKEIVPPPERSHIGRHLLNRHDDGLEKDYQINYLRCIMCGLCVEACPTRALTLTSYYEMAFTSREEAVWTKEQLLEPPPPLGTDPVDREGI